MAVEGGADGGEVKVVIKDGPVDEVDFSKIGLEEAFKLLNGDHKGLTTEQVDARLIEYGYNKLPESNRNEILIFLGYMWNPLAWAMEAAAIISIALLDYADFALIVALLLVNSGISYVEESNADKAIKALAAALAPRAKALRNGKVENIESINLVPGDVIIIRLGDIVPADVKILEEDGGMIGEETPMQIDQAALTGESLPTKKFTGDVAFSGSAIKQGERHAIVYATGVNTFFGRAASLIASTNNVANLQIIMNKIGGMCLGTIGVWVTIELIVQFAKYGHLCGSGEGTLTLNKLSVETFSVFNPSGTLSVTEVLKFAALSANTVTEEPIDVVLEGCYPELVALKEQYKLVRYIPFNPTDKFTQATIRDEKTGEIFRLLKGSPQRLEAANGHAELRALPAVVDRCSKDAVERANGFGAKAGESEIDRQLKAGRHVFAKPRIGAHRHVFKRQTGGTLIVDRPIALSRHAICPGGKGEQCQCAAALDACTDQQQVGNVAVIDPVLGTTEDPAVAGRRGFHTDTPDGIVVCQLLCSRCPRAPFTLPHFTEPPHLCGHPLSQLYPRLDSDICAIPEYNGQLGACANNQLSGVTVLNQCIVEQKYIRGAMMRALLYVQVSVSGQALVFVVRNQGYSLFQRAGSLTYAAFFLAQTGSTVIGLFGFSGYNFPVNGLHNCVFCSQSTGQPTHFFTGQVPQTSGEGTYTASVIGSVGYVIVAWIWAAIWYMGLDPIKWALCWILNEDGFRRPRPPRGNPEARRRAAARKQGAGRPSRPRDRAAPASHLNPLGRASLTKPVNQYITGASASVVPVMRTSDGLTRVSNDPHKMSEIARRSKMLPSSAIDRQSKDAEKTFSRQSGTGPSAAATIKE
ncbi:MAG: hypothetical protein WDW38_005244 [Sanguina aurantia]